MQVRAASWFVMVACALLLFAQACKQESDATIHWLGTPITIDGQFDDWNQVAASRMHEDHAVLKLANDSQALYIYYETDDLDWVRTIKMTGLTVYINHKGSHDKDFFICYRVGPPTDSLLPTGTQDARRPEELHPEMRDQLLESDRQNHTAFTCFVRDWIVEKSIPTDGRQGPAAAFGRQDRRYAYEFSIPLRSSAALYYGLGTTPGATIGLGAEWGGLPRPVLDQGPPEGTDFGGSGGSGMSGGEFGSEMGTGPPPGGGPGRLPEKQEVWIRSVLAKAASTSDTSK